MGIQLTGRLTIRGPTRTLDATALPGRQGRLVLASLGITDQPVSRELLAVRLWGDRPPKAWERDLSAVVSKLRAVLSTAGFVGSEAIRSDAATYHLVPLDAEDVDVRAVRVRAADLDAATDDDAVVALADAIVTATAGDLLPADDEPWLDEVRAELTRTRVRALERAAAVHARRGAVPAAETALREVLALEPFRESAYRALMSAHLMAGNRAEALRTYEWARTVLADELGIDPGPETEALYLDALRVSLPPGGGAAPPLPGPTAPSATVPHVPPVRYARSGRVNVAYQVVGDGPVDLVVVPGWISNLELGWHEPRLAGWLRELAEHCRLILFDKRGTGLSDPVPMDEPPPLEVRMDDVRAVMDEVGSERAVVLGFSEGGALSLLFAASYPERTAGLILWGTWCRQLPADDFPYGWTREQGMRRFVRPIQQGGAPSPHWFAPTAAGDPAFDAWFARYARQSASPGMAIALLRANAAMDVRGVLPSVRVPTLVLHRSDDALVEVGQGRYIAEHVPGARMVELAGTDHWPWIGETAAITAEIVAFLDEAARPRPAPRRLLTTLVAVRDPDDDAVAVLRSRRGLRVAAVPDAAVPRHAAVTARFDGPGRALEAGLALTAAGTARVGLHTGEVTLRGDAVTGIAVETAAALATRAAAGEVLATATVRDLVAGTGFVFVERGQHAVGDVVLPVVLVRP